MKLARGAWFSSHSNQSPAFGLAYLKEFISMKTLRDINYQAAPYGFIATIPAGTHVVTADNLPFGEIPSYWVKPWNGMSEKARNWLNSYGFLITYKEVTR